MLSFHNLSYLIPKSCRWNRRRWEAEGRLGLLDCFHFSILEFYLHLHLFRRAITFRDVSQIRILKISFQPLNSCVFFNQTWPKILWSFCESFLRSRPWGCVISPDCWQIFLVQCNNICKNFQSSTSLCLSTNSLCTKALWHMQACNEAGSLDAWLSVMPASAAVFIPSINNTGETWKKNAIKGEKFSLTDSI